MSEGLRLVLVTLALLAMLVAVGSGPALWARRVLGPAPILAPVVGLALVSAVLTTATAVMSLAVAAYALLVPMMALSLGWAAFQLRKGSTLGLRECVVPGALLAGALAAAVLPALATGSLGPLSLELRDAWWYVDTADWLQHHTVWANPTAADVAHDLASVSGWGGLEVVNSRIGVSGFHGSASTLLGLPPDETLYALTAVVFALMPLSVWMVARALGAGRLGAGLAGLFGASSAFLVLVVDTALGNLCGLVMVPVAIYAGIRAVGRGGARTVVLAGILLAGLVSGYPEFVPPMLAVAGIGALVPLVRALRGRDLGALRRPVSNAALVAVATFAVAPFAVVRTVDYLRWARASSPSFVDRGIGADTLGPWSFGLLHIYEFRDLDTLPGLARAALAILPLLLLVLVLVGALGRRRPTDAVLVLAPVLAASVLGAYVFRTGAVGGGTCQYCLGKALTFGFPSLAVGLGLGVAVLLAAARRPGAWQWVAVGAGAVALAGVGGVLLSEARLASDMARNGAAPATDARLVGRAAPALPPGSGVFIEGPEATGDSVVAYPSLYEVVKRIPNAHPLLDFEWAGSNAVYLTAIPSYFHKVLPVGAYQDPRYRYVLTAFADMRSDGRRTLVRRGRYALQARAPIDVIATRTDQVVGGPDRLDGRTAVPRPTRPFQLWVSSPTATAGHVLVEQGQSAALAAPLAFRLHGRPLRAVRSAGGRRACVQVPLVAGWTRIDVDASAAESALGDGLSRVGAARGPCAEPAEPAPPVVIFGEGAFPVEPTLYLGRSGRWIGTTATLGVGEPGEVRPPARMTMRAVGFVRPQVLTVRLAGRVLARVRAPADFTHASLLRVAVPGGRGVARLVIEASPGAMAATAVNPDDTRRLAAMLTPPRVTRAG
jgi:hypothetical protein